MSRISGKMFEQVSNRAKYRCEYCQSSELLLTTIEIDHIQPQAAGGSSEFDNLCLCCRSCNGFKQDFITGIDPETQLEVRLFHPRKQIWNDHFAWSDSATTLTGLTPIGRATINRLRINRPEMLAVRRIWVKFGEHPPKEDL